MIPRRGSMKKHIHFLLLILGTAVFLFAVHKYCAPLVMPDQNSRYTDATIIAYSAINEENLRTMHETDILKSAIKAFGLYAGFVVLVFGHRVFYRPTQAAPN